MKYIIVKIEKIIPKKKKLVSQINQAFGLSIQTLLINKNVRSMFFFLLLTTYICAYMK